jgi:DNA-binding response OmpR family regulator
MQIIVASGNIFRRELSVFVLSEAGHHVGEVRDAAALLELAMAARPQIVLVDVLLARGDLTSLRRQLSERSQAAILWMTHGAADLFELPDTSLDAELIWPYNPDELLRQIDRLGNSVATPDILMQPFRQRYAGDRS